MPPHEQSNGGQPQNNNNNMASTNGGGRFVVRNRTKSELDEVKTFVSDEVLIVAWSSQFRNLKIFLPLRFLHKINICRFIVLKKLPISQQLLILKILQY